MQNRQNSENGKSPSGAAASAGRRRLPDLLRRGQLRIGPRLAACFAAIILFMLVASLVAMWQFRRMIDSDQRLDRADRISLAAMLVHLDLDSLTSRLSAVADTRDASQFASEAAAARRKFLADATRAEQLFTTSGDTESDPIILSTLQTLRITLPSQIDALVALSGEDDWPAVRVRLTDQVQGLVGLSAMLVERVDREVSEKRAAAIESSLRAQRQIMLVLPATALLTMLLALALGWRVTRTITGPLSELYTGAEALARGEFHHEVNVAGEDELATVGKAFNYAARQLRELYDGLRDSEEQWRAVFNSNPTMYFLIDAAGIIVSVNNLGAQQLGYRADELLGRSVLDVIHESDREAARTHAAQCFAQPGRMMRWEARRVRKDGGILWVRETANAVFLKKHLVLLVVCEDITDQKRAEEAARKSEQELRDLIEKVPAMLFVASTGPLKIFVSRGWAEYTGMSLETTASMGWESVIHPEDFEQHMEKWSVSLASGESFEDEVRFRRTDGQYRWFLVRADPLRDEHGKSLRWYGILTDIEDRKRTEEELRRTEAWLRETQALAHAGSFAWDTRTGNALYISDEWYRIFGFEPEEGGNAWGARFQRAYPEDRVKWQAAIEQAIGDKADYGLEVRLLLPDGTTKHVNIFGHPVLNAAGEVVQFMGCMTDITERKRSEESLRESEERFRVAFENAVIGVALVDMQGHPIKCNPAFKKMLGYSEAELTQMSFTDFTFPADRELDWALFSELVRGERSKYEINKRYITKDGRVIWARLIASLVRDTDGRPKYALGTAEDFTERKRAEEERERLHKLEADLAHINRVSMMGEMAASLAHEMKQPIAAAITSASTCVRWLDHNPPELARARAAAIRVEKDGARAAQIIDRIRFLYKNAPDEREMVDVNEIIREMLVLLRVEANRSSISMRTELAPELPAIVGDRVQLQQVFMNLMLNGLEAMRGTGGELTIKSQLGEANRLLITVSDTGVGLPPEREDRIFDAFFTTKPQGSGMGLAISRSIIESHAGRLWATNNDGRGAAFHFTLPITKAPQQSEA